MFTKQNLIKITPYLWEIPKHFRNDMRVPARIYATEKMIADILDERSIEQLINISTLPGITKYALAMPDIHQGYGFPIGGVAAIRTSDGVISPGGVGYDINCGVRLLTSHYHFNELQDKIVEIANQIQRSVPSGVGRGGKLKLEEKELDRVLNKGIKWAISNGYAFEEDAEVTEENGFFKYADASLVSHKAKKRGADQLGTLGAGNHFLEIQRVHKIFDEDIAKVFGLFEGQITIMIHTGSRGLGHQVCSDYVQLMNKKMHEFGIVLPDRELACAPFNSEPGQQYFKAMAAAANFAWTNRQLITDNIRNAWISVLGGHRKQLQLLYDVAHNIAKLEKHGDDEFIVHRKGATRAFGPGHPDIPEKYQETGQPVLIPGSMGTSSYVLAGTHDAMENTFGSTCHGAGRRMSRTKAKKAIDYNTLRKSLEDQGIVILAGSAKGLLEEAPRAYKDIDNVIEVVHKSKIAKKIAQLKPVAVIKS